MTLSEALVLGDCLEVTDGDFRAAVEALGGLTPPFDAQDVDSAADRLEKLRKSVAWLRESAEDVA